MSISKLKSQLIKVKYNSFKFKNKTIHANLTFPTFKSLMRIISMALLLFFSSAVLLK